MAPGVGGLCCGLSSELSVPAPGDTFPLPDRLPLPLPDDEAAPAPPAVDNRVEPAPAGDTIEVLEVDAVSDATAAAIPRPRPKDASLTGGIAGRWGLATRAGGILGAGGDGG